MSRKNGSRVIGLYGPAAGLGLALTAQVAVAAPQVRDLSELCDRTEFRRSELASLQSSANFAIYLGYTLEHCPGVAAALTNGATASTLPGYTGGGASGSAAVAQTQPRENLCERTEFRRSEITALRKRADFADLLEYTAENCPAVAGALTSGATASVAGGGGAGGGDGREYCDRTEFRRSELTAIQNSAAYPQILEYTLENCPAVAAVLTNVATGAIDDGQNFDPDSPDDNTPVDDDDEGEGGEGGGGEGGGGEGGEGGGGEGGGEGGGGEGGGGEPPFVPR